MGQINPHADRQLSPEKAEAILEGGMQEFWHTCCNKYGSSRTPQVSKATVYSHFQDKEGLFMLIQRLVEGKFRSIFDLANAKVLQTAPEIILQDLANRVLNTGMNEPQFLNFMRVFWESQDGSRS